MNQTQKQNNHKASSSKTLRRYFNQEQISFSTPDKDRESSEKDNVSIASKVKNQSHSPFCVSETNSVKSKRKIKFKIKPISQPSQSRNNKHDLAMNIRNIAQQRFLDRPSINKDTFNKLNFQNSASMSHTNSEFQVFQNHQFIHFLS